MLFHHAPERTDAQIDELLKFHREQQARVGSKLAIHAASEGMEVELDRSGVVAISAVPAGPAPAVPVAGTLGSSEVPPWR